MIATSKIKNSIKNNKGLLSIYRKIREIIILRKKPKKTKYNFSIKGSSAMMGDTFEERETEVFLKLIEKIDVFINVGANYGYYVLHAASKEKKTMAFEPHPSTMQCLQDNIEVNDYSNIVEVFPVALSNKVGIEKIYGFGTGASLIPGWAGSSTKKAISIPTNTLNNILNTRYSNENILILIDVEGLEDKVIDGMDCVLKREISPILMIEIGLNDPSGKLNSNFIETFQKFYVLGYRCWVCCLPIKEVKIEDIRAIYGGINNILHTHNYIFSKNELSSLI
ncbi:FkbM family methyltransferase [Polynucleobacter asymbioticus]|uniref:FkbM family methyltransferase n=1 Tax=Polynucleobacter asymbioticus TaxID=576611 RepID=UPI0008F88927|nr:FkbM family methyltransferase [Polynucleobacter asymbioticus]